MKSVHPAIQVEVLCELFGKSRQAWYKSQRQANRRGEYATQVLLAVKAERGFQPRVGTLKLQEHVNEALAGKVPPIGRDRLYALLRGEGLLIRRRRIRRPAQTNGNGESIYPDLRKGLQVTEINQLWSCDITYIELSESAGPRYCYCTLVTDEKSHMIVGYHVASDMTAAEVSVAVRLALTTQGPSGGFHYKLIFHSDRGGQFKSLLLRKLLQQYEVHMSMCEQGQSSENPVAERINGILKGELLIGMPYQNLSQARTAIDHAVHIYNTRRLHLSCDLMTPIAAHVPGLGPLKKRWTGPKGKKPQPPLTDDHTPLNTTQKPQTTQPYNPSSRYNLC